MIERRSAGRRLQERRAEDRLLHQAMERYDAEQRRRAIFIRIAYTLGALFILYGLWRLL